MLIRKKEIEQKYKKLILGSEFDNLCYFVMEPQESHIICSLLFQYGTNMICQKTADTQHFRVFITAFLHVKTESNINWDHLLVMENFLQNRSAKNKKNLMKTSGLVATKLCFEYLENLCRSWLDFNLMPSVTSICFYEIIQQQVWFKFSPGHIPVNSCNC